MYADCMGDISSFGTLSHAPDPRFKPWGGFTLTNTQAEYSMTDDAFQYAIGNAVDEFLGNAPVADIY